MPIYGSVYVNRVFMECAVVVNWMFTNKHKEMTGRGPKYSLRLVLCRG